MHKLILKTYENIKSTWAPHFFILPMTINWSIDVKDELILWKLSSIWMKRFDEIACILNWIELNLNMLIGIWFDLNWIELQFNEIQLKN